MPEAVEVFNAAGSFQAAFDIQHGILDTYIDDFSKYAKKSELVRLQKVFRQLPRQIGKKAIYSNFSKEDRSGDVKNAIELLSKARLCWQVFHSDCSDLHYWLRERRSSNAEVDFVINFGKTVIPVEVKAGKSGTLKSLHQFVLQKKGSLTVRFDANPPSAQELSTSVNVKNGSEQITVTLMSLPLYLVEELPRLVKEYLNELEK